MKYMKATYNLRDNCCNISPTASLMLITMTHNNQNSFTWHWGKWRSRANRKGNCDERSKKWWGSSQLKIKEQLKKNTGLNSHSRLNFFSLFFYELLKLISLTARIIIISYSSAVHIYDCFTYSLSNERSVPTKCVQECRPVTGAFVHQTG